MGFKHSILMRMFGRPRGLPGRIGGMIMARMNADCGAWVVGLLELQPGDAVLEVGFGPGVAVRRLAEILPDGSVAGIDASPEMVAQTRARNAAAIAGGRVELRQGLAERLPFAEGSFDKAFAINSMQLWPDAVAGLQEMRRVLKPGGRIALGFTPYSGQPNEGMAERLTAAGFTEPRVVETEKGFCALARKP